MSQRPALWIFCRVIDNFGDAGVCWRLARQMADEHRFAVSLFIDLPETLKPLAPELRLRANGPPGGSPDDSGEPVRTPGDRPVNPWTHDALRVIHWVDGDEAAMLALAHPEPVTVISGFGCELPAGVRADLGSGARSGPVWVDFEYLSAEDWVESFHGRASPKPGDSAVAHYFFPGFTPLTGGLLRESGLEERRVSFIRSGDSERFMAGLGLTDPGEDSSDGNRARPRSGRARPRARRISLFCYRNAPLSAWLQAIAESGEPTLVCATAPIAAAAFSAVGASPDADRWSGGSLAIRRLPMLSQDDYDRLLWSCDLNIVRGEDSWIRAHWAARPFIWQPYPQSEGAHRIKLEAFLRRITDMNRGKAGASTDPTDVDEHDTVDGETDATEHAIGPISRMMIAWSTGQEVSRAWHDYRTHFNEVTRLHEAWRHTLREQDDLASRLAAFIGDRLR